MCGIAGYYSRNKFFNHDDLLLMTEAVAHRGPDATGFFEDEFAGLGHKRLSILDLSHHADQPMFSHNEKYVLIYNGEVYNFIELATQLKYHHHVELNTSSDSEVMLESFSRIGIKAVKQFNGMFAFAVYDKDLNELFLFRDLIGIKPLFYYWNNKEFAFASELKALKRLSKPEFEIDNEALYNYLHVGYIPAPQTIYKNVFKLEAGRWLKISKNGIEKNSFWEPADAIEKVTYDNEAGAKKKLDELLNSAVNLHMRSDVPFGVFVSGGTDSSVIAAYAVKNSDAKINTFSIGFREKKHNEAEHAKAIAKYLKTNHHEFIVTYKDALEHVEEVMQNYDEPFADSSAIPTYLVSKLARGHVKVVLSGDGGDELFFGYGSHKWAERFTSSSVNFLKKPAALAFSKMNSKYRRVASLLDYNTSTFLPAHIFSQEQYFFSAKEIGEILSHQLSSNYKEHFFDKFFKFPQTSRKLSPAENQALFDLSYYLPDDLLVKVDRASMMHGLEVRVPLLDHRIVEFALNLSPALKNKNGTTKYLLKEVLYKYVPKSLLHRPKQGFAIPLNNWLKKDLSFLIEKYLNKNAVKNAGMLNYSGVEKLLSKWQSGNDYLYNRVWQLIILQQWHKKNME